MIYVVADTCIMSVSVRVPGHALSPVIWNLTRAVKVKTTLVSRGVYMLGGSQET